MRSWTLSPFNQWSEIPTETVGEVDDVCNVSALAKITKTLVPGVADTQLLEKLERVFTDVMGPFRVESPSGFRFSIVFADQYTKFVFVDTKFVFGKK